MWTRLGVYCFASIRPARTKAAGRSGLYSNINICYTLPGLVFLFTRLPSSYWIFATHQVSDPSTVPGGGPVYCSSLLRQNKKKWVENEKKKEHGLPSIFPLNCRRPGAFTSGEEKIDASDGQRKKQNVSAGRKRGALIERESTSCSGWMSGGVIGDRLRIMNNCIKRHRPLGRARLHTACIAASVHTDISPLPCVCVCTARYAHIYVLICVCVFCICMSRAPISSERVAFSCRLDLSKQDAQLHIRG